MYNIFGSDDSKDFDVMVYIDNIHSIKECKELCKNYESHLSTTLTGKPINVNIGTINELGVLSKVYKGSVDECNNAILDTYSLHKQYNPCFVKHRLKRWKGLKFARSLRIMLSFLSRTKHRKIVKDALSGNAIVKWHTLYSINFGEITEINKNNHDVIEFRKVAAFQIAQCLGLLGEIEIYTKSDASSYYNLLKPYLYREEYHGDILDLYKQIFLWRIASWYHNSLELIDEERYVSISQRRVD